MRISTAVRKGFDQSRKGFNEYRIGCSQCAALVINGIPTHESGCPNQTYPCRGCDTLLRRGSGPYCENCR